MSGAPARGTAPRRPRRHHHHHQHHHHQRSHQEGELSGEEFNGKKSQPEAGGQESRPKVNPIFLWALQREQRIIEVRCEDYDKRNRIKLTKTAQGWRSIPRTASNVYTRLGSCGTPKPGGAGGDGADPRQICESPAIGAPSSLTSSPNSSSRSSPATTISTSTLGAAAWSVSSNKSVSSSCLNISSSPVRGEEENATRDSSSTRSTRNLSDESDEFSLRNSSSGLGLLGLGKRPRKRRRRDDDESEKRRRRRRRKMEARMQREEGGLKNWNNNGEVEDAEGKERRLVAGNDNQNVSEDDYSNGLPEGGGGGPKRRRERGRVEGEESRNRSVISSPRSWELLMNGTRFLDKGPVSVGGDVENEGMKDEKGEERVVGTGNQNRFDLERAKRDQHMQPRVVLEPLQLGKTGVENGVADGAKKDGARVGIVYEDDIEEEEEQEEEQRDPEERRGVAGVEDEGVSQKEEVENVDQSEGIEENLVEEEVFEINCKERESEMMESKKHEEEDEEDEEEEEEEDERAVGKPEIRDILSMLDSTGSPVLATDTPSAHLPSPLDSTMTNISSCYETRDSNNSNGRQQRSKTERSVANNSVNSVSCLQTGRRGCRIVVSPCFPDSTKDQPRSEPTNATCGSRTSSLLSSDSKMSQMCDSSGLTSAERAKIRRDSICERVDSSSELCTSSEILEALRSTPGLSISVTTRAPPGNNSESRMESPENTRNHVPSKRPAPSAIYLERLLPLSPTHQAQHSGAPSPCCSSSELQEDPRNDITLEGILSSNSCRNAQQTSGDKMSNFGLAAVVNRLTNRNRNEARIPAALQVNPHPSVGRHVLSTPEEILEVRKRQHQQAGKDQLSRLRDQRPQSKRSPCTNRDLNYGNPRRKYSSRSLEPANQLRELIESSGDAIPDPLLVPRDRLPALAAAPALEIPKLLTSRPELRLPEALTRPELLRDPDLLVISLAHLQHVLDHGEGPVSEYNYRAPHPLGLREEEEVGEEDEIEEEVEEDEEDEEEDLDVPEQSLDLARTEAVLNGTTSRGRGGVEETRRTSTTRRVPPKLISCKPIGSLMPGPIDLSRSCGPRSSSTSSTSSSLLPRNNAGVRHQDSTTSSQVLLPPPPLLRVRTGLLKQDSENSSEISMASSGTSQSIGGCVQDDSHLWHPLFGSQKIQRQQQEQHQQNQQQKQQQHRTSWHRTTLAS